MAKKTYNIQTLYRTAIPRSKRLRNNGNVSSGVFQIGGDHHEHANKETLDALQKVDSEGYLHVQIDDYTNKVKSGYADTSGDSTKWCGWTFSDFFERVNVGTEDTPIYALRVKIGLFSDSFISTKGVSNDTNGGSGIDIARMWEELASVDSTKLIDISHMPENVRTAVNWVSSVTDEDADSQINKWNEIVSFLNGIDDSSSLESILSGKANTSVVNELSDDVSALSTHITNILARKVNAGTGLTGGGTLNADVTLSLATIGKAGTYTKVVVDAYGRVTGSSTLLESDIPYLSIAKISNLQSTIDTINGKFLNYLPLAGGKMANTNLVTNLNADLLDGVHLADVYRKSGWYRVVPYINNGGKIYHYWFKVAQINYTTTNGLAELELAAVSDANYMYSASARLTIKGYSGNPSCSVSLTSNAYLSTRINVALDKDGGVWVKSNCSWSSYLRWRAIVNDEGYTGITILDGSTKQLDQPINSCVIEENTGATYRQSKDAFETAWAAFDVGIGSFKSYSAQIKILPYNDSAYIEFGNADFTNNVPAFITGYSSNPLNLLTISSHSTIFTGSVTIGGANGVTLSFDATNDMLKFSKGGYFLGAVSTKGVSAETGTGGSGVALSTVWDSLANNTDVYGSTKIHIDHIPTLTKSKISDFPTLVSAFANDAGYITASAIINKADKATTIQGYGLWEKYTDLNEAPMGAFFCGGTSVANSPESGNYISGLTLAKDKNAQFRTQLGFVNNRIFTRQEYGANNWSQWRELAFLGDVAKKATTLAGYGITDAVPYLETSAEIKKVAIGYGYYDAGFASTGGFISAIHHGGNYGFQLNATNTGSDIWYRGLNKGTFTEWKRIAFLDDVVTLSGNQTITGEKVFQTGGGSNVPLRIRNTADSAHIQAGSSGTNNTASLTISGLGRSMLNSLQVYATNTAFHGSISTTKISGITDSSAVANLHAQYSTNLMGDDNSDVNEAPYSYGTRAVNWRFKRAKAIGLATNDYEYAGVLHLTPWNDSTGGPDHQLAFESNGKIKYRSGLSTWNDWKKVVFTEGEDNIQVTNAYARFTANNGSLSGFFGFSGNVIGAYSTSLAEWLISASTSAICIAPQGKVNVGVKTWTPAYDFHVNGSIGANSLTIGQATISWDSTTQMLKVNTGAYFTGPVSTKGVSGGSGLVAVAQFGITWHDAWAIDANSTYVESFGTTNKSISDGQGTTNGSTITIVSDAFSGKKIGDIEIFTLGWEGEYPADARLVPYKIVGNELSCKLYLTGTMTPILFKIKIY